jgi:hypothetical protein
MRYTESATVIYYNHGISLNTVANYSRELNSTHIRVPNSSLYPVHYNRLIKVQPYRINLEGYRSYQGLNPEMIEIISAMIERESRVYAYGRLVNSETFEEVLIWEYRQFIKGEWSAAIADFIYPLSGPIEKLLTVDKNFMADHKIFDLAGKIFPANIEASDMGYQQFCSNLESVA